MLKNYFKIALRTLLKYKNYTFINVLGLTIGISSFMLIALFIQDELSYDRFHTKADRIFRVPWHFNKDGIEYHGAGSPFPMAGALKADFPEIEQTLRLFQPLNDPLIEYQDQKFIEDRFFFADPSFFEVFDFNLKKGNPQTVLSQSNSIIISEAMAQKYFGEKNPIGKTLTYQSKHQLQITGIIEEVPKNSHLKFDFIAPLDFQMNLWEARTGNEGREKQWFWTGAWTYLLLKQSEDASGLKEKFPPFVLEHFPERTRAGVYLDLQPIKDIHLHSQLAYEIETNSSMLYVWIFAVLGLAILFIACSNYINLASSQSMYRIKEMGIRKVMGAQKKQIITQMQSETFLISIFVGLFTLSSITFFLPQFNLLTGKEISLTTIHSLPFLLMLFTTTFFCRSLFWFISCLFAFSF